MLLPMQMMYSVSRRRLWRVLRTQCLACVVVLVGIMLSLGTKSFATANATETMAFFGWYALALGVAAILLRRGLLLSWPRVLIAVGVSAVWPAVLLFLAAPVVVLCLAIADP